MTELTDRDLAIRAIEAYLTWTPRDRRREIAGYIYEALKKLGYLSPEQVEEKLRGLAFDIEDISDDFLKLERAAFLEKYKLDSRLLACDFAILLREYILPAFGRKELSFRRTTLKDK